MLQARPGLTAVFRVKSKNAKARKQWVGDCQHDLKDGEAVRSFVVEAWDDDGHPLVLHNNELCDVRLIPGFLGVEQHGDEHVDEHVVQLIPATDWLVWRVDSDVNAADAAYSAEVIAWALRRDGSIVPVETDAGGYIEASTMESTATLRHRSEGPPPKEWIDLQVTQEIERRKRFKAEREQSAKTAGAVSNT